MSIDAVALLRISMLPAPRTAFGAEHLVQHRTDASLVHTFTAFRGVPPDERALALRRLLGPSLDAHADPRGILFFPDVCEPVGTNYDAIVREVSAAGEWSPKVELDHVPLRIANAPANTHDGLIAQMVGVMGRDAAMQLDMAARVHLWMIALTGEQGDAAAEYAQAVDQVTAQMGRDFAEAYDRSARREVEREKAARLR